MTKTMRSLLCTSMMMRNVGTINNYTITKRFVQTSASCGTRYTKESLVSPRDHLVSHDSWDSLNEASRRSKLKKCGTLAELYQIIRTKSAKMSGQEALYAFEALFLIDKRNHIQRSKILKHEEFLTLCEILKNNIRHLNVHEHLEMLKILLWFNVPPSSVIVEVVLRTLRHSINDLNLQYFSFVDFLLRACGDTPLVNAIARALPVIYKNNIDLKLDRGNIQAMAMALEFLCRRSIDNNLVDVTVAAINNYKEPIPCSMAKSILWSLCRLKCSPNGLSDLLARVQNVLANNIVSLDRNTIRAMISMIEGKVNYGFHRNAHYYHEGLADACASIVISEDWGFTDAVYILDKLIMIGHTQMPLLDYIAAKCFEDPTILEKCRPEDIAIIVAGFSNADYKPVFWDVIYEAVMNKRMLNSDDKGGALTKLAIHLLSLDCYYPEMLEMVFGRYQDSPPPRRTERRQISLLNRAVKTLYPQYDGPWPNLDVVDAFPPPYRQTEDAFPLKTALERALGGSRYVVTGVQTKLEHYIDHVLAMRKGGFPIAINNNARSDDDDASLLMIDDLQLLPDSQVILLCYLPERAYPRNSQRMKATWLLDLKSLEALSGHTVIPVAASMWNVLSEAERIPYLMQAIRLKCDQNSISANSCE